MAIAFDCPYCTAPIRVPDSAGGKRGTCPRCKSGILVPKVKAPPAAKRKKKKSGKQPQATEPETEPEKPAKKQNLKERFREEPDFSGFTGPPAETAPSPGERPQSAQPAVATEVAARKPPAVPGTIVPAPETPIARALKRRRRRKNQIWIPIVFGLLLVGGVAVFFTFFQKTRLEGVLKATPESSDKLQPRVISLAQIPGEKEDVVAVLKSLQAQEWRSPRYTLGATESQLSIAVQEIAGHRFFRVDLSKDHTLSKYVEDHAEELDKQRRKEFRDGLKRFFEQAIGDVKNDSTVRQEVLEDFQRSVMVNANIGGAGYHLVASHKGKSYYCIYQDGQQLYYLLPETTDSFAIRGRVMPDGKRKFPGHYVVNVKGSEAKSIKQKTAEDEPPETMKTAEPQKTGEKKEM